MLGLGLSLFFFFKSFVVDIRQVFSHPLDSGDIFLN